MEQQDKPSFFTIIQEGRNTNCMKVPPMILKYVGEELWSNGINLIGPSGEKWQVTTFLKEEGGDSNMYLQDGWPNFLRDNSVKHKDFLLLTYNGTQNNFQVQIFCKNGCERLSFQKTKQEAAAAATPSVVKKKRGRPRKNSIPF